MPELLFHIIVGLAIGASLVSLIVVGSALVQLAEMIKEGFDYLEYHKRYIKK